MDWFDDGVIQPVMAAPVFTRPMYEALDDYSRDWLLPGLAAFPQPDIVTVLKSNAEFIEAFLAGLSHEMGRELLWRGYPTDQRGTYFRRFWDRTTDELAQDLARFTPTPLGSHLIAAMDGRVVLMVRGQLIRRYPDALVLAMYAGGVDADGVPEFEDPTATPPRCWRRSCFTVTSTRTSCSSGSTCRSPRSSQGGPAWCRLVVRHRRASDRAALRAGRKQCRANGFPRRARLGHPRHPRTGLPGSDADAALNDTDPAGPASATYGADAASTAHVLLRDPVRAAFEGTAMITKITTP